MTKLFVLMSSFFSLALLAFSPLSLAQPHSVQLRASEPHVGRSLMLEGELTLITDAGDTLLKPGMCAGFKASAENGHHLVNRSEAPAKYLVVGSRIGGDEAHYPDDDIQWVADGEDSSYATRKDGTRYEMP